MKTLLLMRHAKSSWKEGEIADIDRPLNKRGKRDAPRMGRLLREEDLLPDGIYCSPALRTRMTAESVSDQSGFMGEIIYKDELYGADPETYLTLARGLPEELGSVLFIGHNPDLEELLEQLTGDWHHLPTGSLAYLALPVQLWQDIPVEPKAKLIYLWQPRELP